MFRNEYQGGTFLEVLNVQGKDLTSKCKMLGSSINDGSREFDKSIKSYVLLLEGESTRTKVIIPKDTKQGLCILQSLLVLQLWVPAGLSFSVEVTISDSSNQKRRILLSTSYKDISVTSFHVKIPLTTIKRELWLNFCLDLKSIVQDCFSGQDFRTIDSIIICANCKLRRVFTLRCQPKDDFTNEVVMVDSLCEEIPKSLQIVAASNVQHGTQVLNMETLKAAGIKLRVGSGLSSRSGTGTEHSRVEKPQRTHIAFGSRVAVPSQPSKPGNSFSILERQASNASNISESSLSLSSSQNDLSSSISDMPQIDIQRPVLQPRPPKPRSSKQRRRPNPRVHSSGRIIKRAKLKLDEFDTDNNNDCCNDRKTSTSNVNMDLYSASFNNTEKISDAAGNELIHNIMDENNNDEAAAAMKVSVLKGMSEKFIEMKMGSQEDEEEYFRKRNDSESQEDSIRSKDGSFSSTSGSEPFFLYSSRPHSVLTTMKTRKIAESPLQSVESQPEIFSNKNPGEANSDIVVIASLESDFHRESSDSEVDDATAKVRRLNDVQRSSPSPKPAESAKIKSSLLKEISPPSHYPHLKYASIQSDSMSWIYESDSSQLVSHSEGHNVSRSTLDPVKIRSDISSRNRKTRVIQGAHDSNEIGSDSEDILSDTSDETSYSTWKEPPAHIRNYRYQDEMHGIGLTLDLSATLPMTPYIEEKRYVSPYY